MVRIQLPTGYLDVKEGTAFPLNFQVGDIRDISQRKGNFSKTIKLIGSKNNNKLLNQYYDVNIQAGTFNINTLTTCSVIQDGIPIMENVSMQLTSVVKVQDTSGYEESVEYEVLVKESKGDFFTAINNLELTDIDFSDLNHTYDAFNVVNRFTNTVVDGFKYFLPASGDAFYITNEFKPAIFAKTYLDRIFANAGFQYNWAGLTAARFDKLIIPYNGDVDNFDYNDYMVKAEKTTPFTITGNTSVPGYTNIPFVPGTPITGWTETEDPQNIYNPVTGVYSTPFNISSNNAQEYTYTVQIRYRLDLINPTGATIFSAKPNNAGIQNPNPVFYRPGVIVQGLGGGSSAFVGQNLYTNPSPPSAAVNTAVQCPNSVAPGTTTLLSQTVVVTLPVTSVNFQQLSSCRLYAIVNQPFYIPPGQSASGTAWRVGSITGAVANGVRVDMVIDSIYLTIVPNNNIVAIGGILEVNDYVPKKIKQSDFVKGIFNMFNLYADVDKVQPNTINLIHRDDYYDSGAEVDWTYKLAKDQEQELSFLPELTSKKLILTYAPDKDNPNETYTNATNQIYGQAEVVFDNEYVKEVTTKTVLFSPTPVIRTPFNAYVPMIAGQTPKNNIRILYDSGVMKSCNAYNIYDYGLVGQSNVITYPYVGHFDDPLLPTFDINFATCSFYYYNPTSLTENNLYNRYWRRTMGQINNGKMLTAMFNLTESDIQKMKLNDKIRIDNSWWNINKVIDYDANATKLTKVELISIDTEIDFMPFSAGFNEPGIGLPNVGPIQQVANDTIIKQKSAYANVTGEGGMEGSIIGKGNIVPPGFKTLIVGDGYDVTDNGIVVDNLVVRNSYNGVPIDNTPKRYMANLTQAGIANPTAWVLEGSFGTITWVRIAQGQYWGYLDQYDQLVPLTELSVMISSNIFDGLITAQYLPANQVIEVFTTQIGVGLVDGYLNSTSIMIYYFPQ
jgi:hypothetical protein